MTHCMVTKLLDPKKLLEIKLFDLVKLKLYFNEAQKNKFDEILDAVNMLDESSIEEFITNEVNVLIEEARTQKREFLNNAY